MNGGNKVAKNNLVKWIVGATSVLAFTGFVGLAKEFDSTQQNKASASDETVKSETINSVKDPVKDEFLGADSNQVYKDGEKYEYKKKHHDDDDDDDDDDDNDNYENKGGYTQGSGNTEPTTKKYRTRAS